MDNINHLSGLEKASVLVLSLGLKQSAKVFDHLTEEEREILGAQIVKLKHVDSVTRQQVLNEVSELVKNQPLARPVTPVPAISSNESVNGERQPDLSTPLKWIEAMEPGDAATILSSERAHNVALVVARLAPKSAADIISHLDERLRQDAVHQLSYVRAVSDEVIEAIDETLRRKASKQSGASDKRYSPSRLLESLGGVMDGTHKSASPTPPESRVKPSIPRVFSSPEDAALLSDAEIRLVLSEVDHSDLCQVLKVAGDDLKSAVMRNLSDEARASVDQELNSAGQVKLRELEAAQRRFVDAMKRTAGAESVVTG